VDGEGVVVLFEEGVNAFENIVSSSVLASEIPPTFDNSLVIAVGLMVSSSVTKPRDRSNEELEADDFSPSDVSSSIQRLPTGDKAPSSPSPLDGDGNADARTCI
jgi:hypothetical protein